MANQTDIVVNKPEEKSEVKDEAIPSDCNIMKKKKLENHGLEEEKQKLWTGKASVVPVVIGAVVAVMPKLEEWLQQIPGITSEIYVQKNSSRNR